MNGFQVKIIADSVSPTGKRLTTFQLRYPRFIHSELMTHRVLSRNAMSSRAIPVAKMVDQVRNDPAMPIYWGKNQPGMQAAEELTGEALRLVQVNWRAAALNAAMVADQMAKDGAHKQIVNRILEPWQWMHTVVTATEWDNFFALRCHKDAQPEFKYLAEFMRSWYNHSTPTPLDYGQWHLPYVTGVEVFDWTTEVGLSCALRRAVRVSSARCARVSYLTHDNQQPKLEEDLKLYERLALANPPHMSPLEHQAAPDRPPTSEDDNYPFSDYQTPVFHGNFVGWLQHRKFVENKREVAL